MVLSLLNPSISYPELKQLDSSDSTKESSLFQITIETPDISPIDIIIAVGNADKKHEDKNITYFRVYLVKSNNTVIQIGIYEIKSTTLSDHVDNDGNLDVESLDNTIPLLYKFANKDMIEKSRLIPEKDTEEEEEEEEEIVMKKKKGKKNESSSSREIVIPAIRSNIFTASVGATIPAELREETKKQAKDIREKYKQAPKDTWIERFMENDKYYIVDNEGGGDCLFATVRDAFSQIGQQTTVAKLRESVSNEASESIFLAYKEQYDNAIQSVISDTEKIKELEVAHQRYKKLYQDTIDRDEKKQLAEAGKKANDQRERIIREKRVSQEIVGEFKYMKKIPDLATFKKKIKTCEFWGETWSISTMERILNIKFILMSEENYKQNDFSNVLNCGHSVDSKIENTGRFEPEFYIILDYNGSHYKLIGYRKKQIFTFKELPYDIKKLAVDKCMESNAGLFSLIPDLIQFKDILKGTSASSSSSSPEPKFDELSNAKIMGLYDDDTIFNFYSKSNDKPLPGKGNGEKMGDLEGGVRAYSELAGISQWRKKLADEWTPQSSSLFTLDNHKWSSVEHYYQAAKFKNNNKEFYLSFSLDSNTDLAKDVAMATAAGGKTGKYKGDLIRPREVDIDPDFFPKLCEKEKYAAQLAKFGQNEELKKLLLSTKKSKLVHHVRGKEPELAETLMTVRDTLRKASL